MCCLSFVVVHGPISIFLEISLPLLLHGVESSNGRGQRVDKKGYNRTW